MTLTTLKGTISPKELRDYIKFKVGRICQSTVDEHVIVSIELGGYANDGVEFTAHLKPSAVEQPKPTTKGKA